MKQLFSLPFRDPSYRQANPTTPIPPTRVTGPITRKELVERLASEKEDTGEIPVVSVSLRSTAYTRDDLEPTLLLFAATRDHIQRCNKIPPREIYVCRDLYLLIMADINSQSSEPFAGKFLYSVYDRSEPVCITIGIDSMINESLPINKVICIH